MKISIVTLFPNMIKGFFEESMIKRAIEKSIVEIEYIQLRDFAIDNYATVDDRPYGGGAGMILKVDIIDRALQGVLKNTSPRRKIVSTSPRGVPFNQSKAQEYATLDHLILFAGHYEGIDERALSFFDEEISLGDFVMTGGEITCAAIVDAVTRLLPGVLKKQGASDTESFWEVSVHTLLEVVGDDDPLLALKNKGVSHVNLLEYPHYTRPEDYNGQVVPSVLLQGNHKEIERWRLREAYENTKLRRPDLLI